MDERGRITIPSEIRRSTNITGKALIVNAGDHIKVIPIPDDPFRVLEGAVSVKKEFTEIRQQAEKEAQEEYRKNASA